VSIARRALVRGGESSDRSRRIVRGEDTGGGVGVVGGSSSIDPARSPAASPASLAPIDMTISPNPRSDDHFSIRSRTVASKTVAVRELALLELVGSLADEAWACEPQPRARWQLRTRGQLRVRHPLRIRFHSTKSDTSSSSSSFTPLHSHPLPSLPPSFTPLHSLTHSLSPFAVFRTQPLKHRVT
jgi:hypothetical protein